MSPRKSAESELVGISNLYSWFTYKFGDVRYCIHCHQPLPKSELKPDYVIAPVFTWVECKNSDQNGRWPWAVDIGPQGRRTNQRTFLQTHGGWLFLVLGNRAPLKKSAWLIPWVVWEKKIEPVLIKCNVASLKLLPTGKVSDKDYRPMAAAYIPDEYMLKWVQKQGWVIPQGHPWWSAFKTVLEHQLEICNGYINP